MWIQDWQTMHRGNPDYVNSRTCVAMTNAIAVPFAFCHNWCHRAHARFFSLSLFTFCKKIIIIIVLIRGYFFMQKGVWDSLKDLTLHSGDIWILLHPWKEKRHKLAILCSVDFCFQKWWNFTEIFLCSPNICGYLNSISLISVLCLLKSPIVIKIILILPLSV